MGRDAEAGVDDLDADGIGGGAGGEGDLALGRGVFDRVVEEVGEGLLESDAVGGERGVGAELAGEGDGFFLGEDGVEVDDFLAQPVQVYRREVEVHGSCFSLGDVHESAEHGEDAVGFLYGISEGFLESWGIFGVVEGLFGAVTESGERGSEVVGDIIECISHPLDELVIFLEHLVEEEGEFAEFVLSRAGGDAGVSFSGGEDGLDGGGEVTDWGEGAVGDPCAAVGADDDDADHGEGKDPLEPAEEPVALGGAFSDLEDIAVGEEGGTDEPDLVFVASGEEGPGAVLFQGLDLDLVEVEVAPVFRGAEELGGFVGADDADEEGLGVAAAGGVEALTEEAQAALGVPGTVFLQSFEDGLAFLVLDGSGEDEVGAEEEERRPEDKGRGVPDVESSGEVTALGGGGWFRRGGHSRRRGVCG